MWHFPGFYSFFSASFIRCDLNPLLFLFFGDVDTLGHKLTHILEVVIVAALPTPSNDALALRLLLMTRLSILMSADVVVLDHG